MAPMITIRYYQPGKIITLYYYKKHKRFKGVLYFNYPATSKVAAQIPAVTTKRLEKLSKIFLGLATITLLIIFTPPIYAGVSYNLNKVFPNRKQITSIQKPIESEEFSLEIPKINLASKVIPNVDPASEDIYLEKLKEGVAHAKGSYLPGEGEPVVLFAHSTNLLAHIIQYNARFYALKDLEEGDGIKIKFKGKQYEFKVTDKKIINPMDLDALRQSKSKLILSTCWPPGTDWQRLVIFST